MKTDLIPHELHYLIHLVEKWGLGDDGYRDEQIINATEYELIEISNSLPTDKLEIMNEWLERNATNSAINMTEEYQNYSCYIMAFEYASCILQNRNKNSE